MDGDIAASGERNMQTILEDDGRAALARAAADDYQGRACPSCGTTRHDLYTDGRMGCADCYQVFAAEASQALQEIHGAVQHIGKA
jgi:protein-arginine kinase activator protein McsA